MAGAKLPTDRTSKFGKAVEYLHDAQVSDHGLAAIEIDDVFEFSVEVEHFSPSKSRPHWSVHLGHKLISQPMSLFGTNSTLWTKTLIAMRKDTHIFLSRSKEVAKYGTPPLLESYCIERCARANLTPLSTFSAYHV